MMGRGWVRCCLGGAGPDDDISRSAHLGRRCDRHDEPNDQHMNRTARNDLILAFGLEVSMQQQQTLLLLLLETLQLRRRREDSNALQRSWWKIQTPAPSLM